MQTDNGIHSPKQFKKASFATIEDAMKRLGITVDAEMATLMGFSSSAMAPWRKSGTCSETAALAAEALVRRREQNYRPPQNQIGVVVCLVDPGKMAGLEPVLKAMGIAYQQVL